MAITLFFTFLLICCGSIVIYSIRLGISPMPSSKKAKIAMIQLIPYPIEEGVIYELGSGWGGLAFLLAKRYPHAQVIGFELSPIPYLFSRMTQLLLRRSNLTFLREDFHVHNLRDAKAVFCYLFPGGMRKLSPKLKRELPEKCPIISNTFSLLEWENSSQFFLDDWSSTPIYRYFR